MNRILILLPLALLATVPQAATAKNRVGYVNVQAAVKTMPNSAAYLALTAKADKDMAAQRKTLQTLTATASATRKAADIAAAQKAQQAYASAQASYQSQVAKAFAPLASRMNSAVAKVARANGYSVVLDQRTAGQSGLVVYANQASADLTAAVIKALK